MANKLEDFVRNNREQFDDLEPHPAVWKKISGSLFARKTGLWNNVALWRVAAMLLLGVCVYLLTPGRLPMSESHAVLNEFRAVESYYVTEISEKVRLIEEIATDGSADAFTVDLHRLEAMYQVLREQMKENPTQEVKDALVLNLLVRINLLNQQIHSIEQSSRDERTTKASI